MTSIDENLIATATKKFVQLHWRLPLESFEQTQNQAWILVAARILSPVSATMPVKSLTDRGVRIGDVK